MEAPSPSSNSYSAPKILRESRTNIWCLLLHPFLLLNTGPQVANVNPKSLCDFNPCEEAGCLYDPAARCITDFECNPVFFDANGKMLSQCKGKMYETG